MDESATSISQEAPSQAVTMKFAERRAEAPPSPSGEALYFNRELSLLEFNRRVLAQAEHPHTPLL